MAVKPIKLSMFGEEFHSRPKAERRLTYMIMVPLSIVLYGVFALLYALALNSFLDFVPLEYWEWFKIMVVYYFFTWGWSIVNLRQTEALKSILRRV